MLECRCRTKHCELTETNDAGLNFLSAFRLPWSCSCLPCMSIVPVRHAARPSFMLHVHVHVVCPCRCCMPMSMSVLHVQVHTACPGPCPCCLSVSMLHFFVHVACPCPCPPPGPCLACLYQGCMSRSILYVCVHGACRVQVLSMSLTPHLVHATCPCLWCMSKSMLHVYAHVHSACPYVHTGIPYMFVYVNVNVYVNIHMYGYMYM